MEDRVLAEYLKTGHQLRQKYEEIKSGRQKRYIDREEKYKSLISPLQNYGSYLGSQTEILKEMNNKMASTLDDKVGELALKYLLDPPGRVDKKYGIYRDNDGLYIGSKQISIFNNDIYLEDDKTRYRGTQGLWELMTMEHPNNELYNDEDLKNYATIVLKSGTFRPNNNLSARRFKIDNGGYKYEEIILPILYEAGIKQRSKTSTPIKKKDAEGSGLQKIVTTTNAFPEYIYYNNIDELLERLYILYGELKAGNTNTSIKNEIIEIISEFKKF